MSAQDSAVDGPVIDARELRRSFAEVEAVRGIDIQVASGECFGFLGPNGAGKSTTIKMLCTLLKPTAGSATVAGFDVVKERDQVRRHIGLVFQEPTLDGYLTAKQNLLFHADIYGLSRSSAAPRIDALLEMVGLTERRDSEVINFSGGMKRRLEIARGLLHSPRVLFLDEPTIGLDPESRAQLWRYVDALREQEHITVFLTTHYMDEAERCDRIAIINKGVIGALDSPAALKASVGHDRVRVHSEDDARLAQKVRDAHQVEVLDDKGAFVVLTPDGEQFVPRLFELGVPVLSVNVSRPSLDDVFMTFAGSSMADADEGPDPSSRLRVMQIMGAGGRR
jgi:ABC-2 type transport system ATP-binding protein